MVARTRLKVMLYLHCLKVNIQAWNNLPKYYTDVDFLPHREHFLTPLHRPASYCY